MRDVTTQLSLMVGDSASSHLPEPHPQLIWIWRSRDGWSGYLCTEAVSVIFRLVKIGLQHGKIHDTGLGVQGFR